MRTGIPIFQPEHRQIDLHSHILPGVDDGARNDDQALDMLRAAVADGTQIIAATPHAHHVRAHQITDGVARLRELAAGAGIEIEIIPGHEARLAPDIAERYQQHDIIPLNHTSYQLIELHLFEEWPKELSEKSIGRIQAVDLVPIMAHPERYGAVQNDIDWLDRLIDRGILLQINSHSLTGYHGPDAQATAERMIERRLVHIIASDAHNPGRRPPAIRNAIERAAIIAGPEYVHWMMGNAAAIVRGDRVSARVPELAREG